ncbi:MAG: murein biosynthesis integral membrane protein MurJ, partial [Acidobacteria bacterium]
GVLRALGGVRPRWAPREPAVRAALVAVGPAIAGRGVYQLSAWLDLFLASWLAAGAIGALGLAQTLYVLPVSLFAMSVAAAELPELARESDVGERFDRRIAGSLGRIAFLVVPSAVGYLALGAAVVTLLFRSGAFGDDNVRLVSGVLAAYAAGLLPTTWSRLLQNAFFALGDTRSPARCAVLRLAVSAAVAVPAMAWLDRVAVPGDGLRWGAAGLAIGSAAGAWAELAALRVRLARRRPGLRLPWRRPGVHAALACAALVPAVAVWRGLGGLPPRLHGALALAVFAGTYLAAAAALRVPELAALVSRRGVTR